MSIRWPIAGALLVANRVDDASQTAIAELPAEALQCR